MPANRVVESVYLGPFSSLAAVNEATPYKPGELGMRVATNAGLEFQKVQLDSGATSATAAGVVAAGQLAYWKNKANYIVTNDVVQAIGGQAAANTPFRNEVAGVFGAAIGAGNFCWVQQKGNFATVAAKASTFVVGDWVVSDNTAGKAQVDQVSPGTAPTIQPLGKAAAARSGSAVSVDLDIPGIP